MYTDISLSFPTSEGELPQRVQGTQGSTQDFQCSMSTGTSMNAYLVASTSITQEGIAVTSTSF